MVSAAETEDRPVRSLARLRAVAATLFLAMVCAAGSEEKPRGLVEKHDRFMDLRKR